MKELFEYIFLGVLQGITEPIPVSSSGHILILQTLLEKINQSLNINFEILATITNFGSLVAIFILFREKIVSLIKSFFTFIFDKDKRVREKANFDYCIKVIIATIPAGLAGLVATKLGLLDFLEKKC